LGIEMRMNIHKPRSHRFPVSVDFPLRSGRHITDRHDPIPVDGEIRPSRRGSSSINNGSIAND
jgi:hypothetical protein